MNLCFLLLPIPGLGYNAYEMLAFSGMLLVREAFFSAYVTLTIFRITTEWFSMTPISS